MSYKIGDEVKLEISPAPVDPSGLIYSYVWMFWDGSIQATVAPFVTKVVNIGGNPSDGDKLIYSCRPTLIDGTSGSVGSHIVSNGAPVIVDGTCSKNDDTFSYATTLALTAYSLDGHVLSFDWKDGVTSLGAGVLQDSPTVNTTWVGNDTSVPLVLTATRQELSNVLVDRERVIVCTVTDTVSFVTSNGTFSLRGTPAPSLGVTLAADTNAVTTDATSLPIQRIGLGQTMTFVAYAVDIDGIAPSFLWDLTAIPGGWTVPETNPGVVVAQPDGSFMCTLVKSISAEVVAYGTAKTVTAICRVTGNAPSRSAGKTTEVQMSAVLLRDNPPNNTVVSCTRTDGSTVNMATDSVTAGTKLIFSALTTDPDLDVVTQAWRFDGHPFPSPLRSYGPKVVVDTTGYASGAYIQGQITSTDRMGPPIGALTTSFIGPKIT